MSACVSTSAIRWWAWADGIAHARRYKSRGPTACGARLHRNACYATGAAMLCKKCLAALWHEEPPRSIRSKCVICGARSRIRVNDVECCFDHAPVNPFSRAGGMSR